VEAERVVHGDIWEVQRDHNLERESYACYVVVPTNLDGVFGRGLAKQCADKHPWSRSSTATVIPSEPTACWPATSATTAEWTRYVLCLAVKEHPSDQADKAMILFNLGRLVEWLPQEHSYRRGTRVLVPLLGAGFGELDPAWSRRAIERFAVAAVPHLDVVLPTPEVGVRYAASLRPASRRDARWA
jgi:hypothetical protein